MKILNVTFFLLIILITSCSKNEISQVVDSKKISTEAIQQVLSSDNVESQKAMYRALNKYEKNEIWSQKFIKFLATQKLSISQRTFLNNIISDLQPDLFEEGTVVRLAFNEKEMRTTAISLFGMNDAVSLLTSLVISDVSNGNTFVEPGPSADECKCNRDHDWCATYMYCRKRVCDTGTGCGTLFLYTCNGLCDL